MDDTARFTPLADFAATWAHREPGATVDYAYSQPPALTAVLEELQLTDRLEDLLDTVVEWQRAEWLQDGVYVGPRVMGDTYREVLAAARTLHIAVPPTVASGSGYGSQGVFGTDNRAFLHLSSYFVTAARPDEVRFLVGRFAGHIHAQDVTWLTLYALTVDQAGLRGVARKALGAAADLLLTPVSVAGRLALSKWRRSADITADRAGMLCGGSLESGQRCLLRLMLGTSKAKVDVDAYLEQLEQVHIGGSPGRWAELLSSHPFIHRRMRAMELFARSRVWVDHGGEPLPGALLSKAELDEQTSVLLRVN